MTRTICDKCGSEFHECLWQPLQQQWKFPSYMITVIEDVSSQARKVDLCYNCLQRFDDWLHNREDATPEE